jgi:hypothetical protein
MPTVTSENRDEFIANEMAKNDVKKKEKQRPKASNAFFHRYKDVVTPDKDYFNFVKVNEPHVREYSTGIKNEVSKFTGLNDKQKAKKLHERMKEAVNHVTETWDYTKPEN